ncbi:MAG: putative DNA-binding domain-containing protein [Xanthomonadales bacterium]|jgi:hypothetical protein|nr:putative DNA-binding domain-containing protein [Xanthomonadales bacterium]
MSLHRLQNEFAAHIRDPQRHARPQGIEDRRMKIYRDLFFNNINSLLASHFPVLRKLLDDGAWDALVRDFYANHRSKTPLFPEIGREFLRYLQDEREAQEDDPPFLLELAHYEWVELALSLDERSMQDITAERNGDLLRDTPVLSPLVQVLSYRFPVHRIRPDFQPGSAPEQATHLLVYRNRDDEVKFMQLNDVTRLLLEFMQASPQTSGRELLEQVANAIGHSEPQKVVSSGAELLQGLAARDILLGTRRAGIV